MCVCTPTESRNAAALRGVKARAFATGAVAASKTAPTSILARALGMCLGSSGPLSYRNSESGGWTHVRRYATSACRERGRRGHPPGSAPGEKAVVLQLFARLPVAQDRLESGKDEALALERAKCVGEQRLSLVER